MTRRAPKRKKRQKHTILARWTKDGELEEILPTESTWYNLYTTNGSMQSFDVTLWFHTTLTFSLLRRQQTKTSFHGGQGRIVVAIASTVLYDKYVHTPTREEITQHKREFEMAGLHSGYVCGFSDTAHIIHEMTSWRQRRSHKGNKNCTGTYNLTVSHRRKILGTTRGHGHGMTRPWFYFMILSEISKGEICRVTIFLNGKNIKVEKVLMQSTEVSDWWLIMGITLDQPWCHHSEILSIKMRFAGPSGLSFVEIILTVSQDIHPFS
eukprot:CCRYP_000177-RA/>CCRYP_000177-RA protein AED:0.14 eAED:0.22 QI:0/0/0/1/0/0/4/0/265